MSWEEEEYVSIWQRLWCLASQNFFLKVLSVAIAMLLFFWVRAEQVRDYTKVARIRAITGENMMVVGSPEKAVQVTVRVPMSFLLKSPSDEEMSGEVDLTKMTTAGTIRFKLLREHFPNLDERYELMIHDPYVDFEIDRRIRKTMEVRVAIEGKPRDGYTVERTLVSPHRIEVVGARKELVQLRELATSVIDINGIDQSFSTRARILVNEESSLQLSEKWVNVQVVVGRRKEMRLFSSIPLTVLGGKKLVLSPTHVLVELEGAKDILDEVAPRSIKAFVDSKDYVDGVTELSVHLELPLETTLVRVAPAVVSVSLTGTR